MLNNRAKFLSKRRKKKLSRILLFTSIFSLYPSIVLSTLSSCSKIPTINNDLLKLDPLGKLINNLDYKDAIQGALTNKQYYAKFKYALANEVILKWYEDRAAGGNIILDTNLKQWKQEINDEYNQLVQNKKDTYGPNYQFYLQNEVLSNNGGTEETYKHNKLVEKVRNDFINSVWAKDYFTISTTKDHNSQIKFPNIFCDIEKNNLDSNLLNNPSYWSNIGFYAKSVGSFTPESNDSKYLATNLDGDYATIQQYVFDRWYATEKPFFIIETNFDYSTPPKTSYQGYNGLSTIYNCSEFDNNNQPNENFPCFANSNGKTFQQYKDFFRKFNRSILSLYSNPTVPADKRGKKVDNYCEGAIKVDDKFYYIPKELYNGTIDLTNFNEDDEFNNSFKLVLGSQLSSHDVANIMAYGSLYNDLIFSHNINDDSSCLNFLSWKKFSEDDEIYPLSKLNENKDEKIIIFPMMKLFMLSKNRLDKYNDGSDKSKINSYLDFAEVYDLINKHRKVIDILGKINDITISKNFKDFDTLLEKTENNELKKIVIAVKEIVNNDNSDKIRDFINKIIRVISVNDDKVFDDFVKKNENNEFNKILQSIKNAKDNLKNFNNESWYDLITRDFQKNYLINYEEDDLNNVANSWSNRDDDKTYNLEDSDRVRYALNTVKIDLPFCPKQPTFEEIDKNNEIDDEDKDELKYNNFDKKNQPWLFFLNNKGLNIATIDGHEYVADKISEYVDNNSLKTNDKNLIKNKLEFLKNVFKYRLMQQKLDRIPSSIKFDVLGKNGQLSDYFIRNFDNIILELAAQTYLSDLKLNFNENMNIFKSYKFFKEGNYQKSDAFLTKVVQQQNLGSPIELVTYLVDTIKYEIYDDDLRKYVNTNDRIYKSCDQLIEYAKFIKAYAEEKNKKNNYKKKLGMAAPIPYRYFNKNGVTELNSRYVYVDILHPICAISDSFFGGDMYLNNDGMYQEISYAKLLNLKEKLDSSKYIKNVKSIKPNLVTSGFSPQIEQANKMKSNNFWFNSSVVDYTMQNFLSQQNDNYLINQLNTNMFSQYITKMLGDKYENDPRWKALTNDFNSSSQYTSDAMLSAYCVKKIFNESNNYNKLCELSSDYFTNIFNAFKNYYKKENLSSSNLAINYELSQLYATIAYLIADDYANFYKILQEKFSDDERFFLGYFSQFLHNQKKLDRHCFIENFDGFDHFNLRGKNDSEQNTQQLWDESLKNGIDERIKDDKYWSVIKKDGKFFAGFNGLINQSSNIFSMYPSLKEAIFSKKNSFANKDHKFNTGIWYEYAGEYDNNGKKIDLVFNFGSHGPIDLKDCVYLARIFKKICAFSLLDDLKKFVDNLNQSYYGFEKLSFDDKKDLLSIKYEICTQLKNETYKKCFEQLINVSAHRSISSLNDISNKSYYFINKDRSNYSCLLVTQINKNNLYSHNLTPVYNDGKWTKGQGGISPEEFFYLVIDLAMDAGVQKRAHRDMRKKIFGYEKIKVFDGKLYNILGSTWIKKWHKKIVGK